MDISEFLNKKPAQENFIFLIPKEFIKNFLEKDSELKFFTPVESLLGTNSTFYLYLNNIDKDKKKWKLHIDNVALINLDDALNLIVKEYKKEFPEFQKINKNISIKNGVTIETYSAIYKKNNISYEIISNDMNDSVDAIKKENFETAEKILFHVVLTSSNSFVIESNSE